MKKSKHPLFRKWTHIRYQITNEHAPQHYYYQNLDCVGLDDFSEFVKFIEGEIGPLPSPGYKLGRKDQRGGWVRGNIYWAMSHREISQRFVDLTKFKVGRRWMSYREMSEQSGINEHTIRCRIERGWSPKDAFTITPKLGNRIYGTV